MTARICILSILSQLCRCGAVAVPLDAKELRCGWANDVMEAIGKGRLGVARDADFA